MCCGQTHLAVNGPPTILPLLTVPRHDQDRSSREPIRLSRPGSRHWYRQLAYDSPFYVAPPL
ncbi:MAG: hypothetical protein Q9203_002569 [Teloschistes exilis]